MKWRTPRSALRLAVILALLAGSAQAGQYDWTKKRKSPAHPLVLLAPRALPEATIRIQFDAGSYDDGNLPGLTRFAQHAMIRANESGDYRALMLDIYSAGARLELETGMRHCALTLTAPRAAFPSLAKRLLAMCLAPRVGARQFEQARSRMQEDVLHANPSGLEAILTGYVFLASGHDFDPFGDEVSIKQTALADIRRHISRHMAPANAMVTMAGAFSPRRMLPLINRYRGGKQVATGRDDVRFSGSYRVESPYEIYMLAYPLTLESTQQIAAAHLLGAMLQESVQNEFRRQGIAYWTTARPIHREWIDFIMVFLPVYRQSSGSIEREVQRQIDRLRAPQAKEAFQRNKAFLLKTLVNKERDSHALALALANSGGDRGWYGRELVAQIEALDYERFVELTGSWLGPRSRVQVSLSPKISN